MSRDFQPRQPKGIPVGGQFAEHSRAETDVSLAGANKTAPVLDRLFGDAARHEALTQRGYVPPTFFNAVDDPRSTALRREWWDQHFAAGEHAGDGQGYPKMPDDYTPKRTLGQALSGHRRTHRMKYTDDGVTFRMPSVTSIKRYAAETGTTFDVPVSAVNAEGRTISGWVRVTPGGPGTWSVEALGMGGTANAKVSEAVASRLESRRPRLGPRETGSLLERHKARLAAEGAAVGKVRSTWVSAVGYSAEDGVMFTRTTAGRTYGHHVDPATFMRVRNSGSPGKAFNELVKGSPAASVSECGQCGRTYAESRGHTCPVTAKPPTPEAKPQNIAQRRRAEDIARGAQRLREPPATDPSRSERRDG